MARQIGLKRIGFALYEGLKSGKPSWSDVEIIKQGVEISTTNVYSEYSFYSDDTVEESEKVLTSVEIALTLGYINNEFKAKYLGMNRTSAGFTTTGGSVKAPSLAIVYEITKSNGESDYKVLYNCKLALDESTNRTKEDEIEGVEIALSGLAIECPGIGNIVGEISTDEESEGINEEQKQAILDAFFTTIQTGEILG